MFEKSPQFIRYVGVQLVAYAVEWAVFLAARSTGVPLIVSNVIAKFAALILAFFLHRSITFQNRSDQVVRQSVAYFATFLVNISVASALLWALQLGMPEAVAKVAADMAMVVISFALARTVVFRPDGKAHSAREGTK